MIKSIHFQNFKALRDATLPLGRLTLIVGPNGSGKSTVFQAIDVVRNRGSCDLERIRSLGANPDHEAVRVHLAWDDPHEGVGLLADSTASRRLRVHFTGDPSPDQSREIGARLRNTRIYAFEASAIARPTQLEPRAELGSDGSGLAVVLDRLRDEQPDRLAAMNRELVRWLPEFDEIAFQTPGHGMRGFALRTTTGQQAIGADDLSDGTLLAVALLSLAYAPVPPPLVCLEEPDHGIHPRLLRDVRDALYRLAYPEQFGEQREPVQIIATTHSPIMLDLFRDHPEEIVIANKHGVEATFERLVDRPDLDEILADTPLGDAWYSGILGGVPTGR